MGDVYILRKNWDEKKPKISITPSENLGKSELSFINGNVGIFFYERDLWDIKQLKEDLTKLVEAISDLSPVLYWDTDGKLKKTKKGVGIKQ